MSECVIWEGYINPEGYGRTKDGGAHRLAWEKEHGEPPRGELHHICGNRACVNVEHLEVISHAEHMLLHQAERTTCRRGHDRSIYGRLERGRVYRCMACHPGWKLGGE